MRKLKKDEIDLIVYMLRDNLKYKFLVESLVEADVLEMDDGNMGSLRFIKEHTISRCFSEEISSLTIYDLDDVPVSFTINIDNQGDLFELDAFKADFSPLKAFPSKPYKVVIL